jgi:uncharacterized repeat protein (TIGR03943 family)
MFGVYNAILYFQGELIFYIHPRYIWLSIVGACIAIAIGLFGMFRSFRTHNEHNEHSRSAMFKDWVKKSSIQDSILIIVLLCGLFIEPQQLSSVTAIQRSTDTSIQTTSTNIPTQDQLFFNFDYTTLTILDWTNLMRANPNVESYRGKPVHIVGFVYQDTNHTDDYYFAARFVITCCAVDATPVKLLVKGKLPEDLKANDWIDLQGHFDIDTIAEEKVNVIIPDQVTKILQPQNPYVY